MAQLIPSFLGIPCELRMLIYDLLVGDRVFWINFTRDGLLQSRLLGSLAIMRVNKQVRDEAQQALRVRTLRVNKFDKIDVKLFSRIPRIVSRWAPTIETVLIEYSPFGIDGPQARRDELRMDRLLTGLNSVLPRLPRLVELTITCDILDEYSRDRELELQFLEFSKALSISLSQFNRIHIEMKRKQKWAALTDVREAIFKFSKSSNVQRSFLFRPQDMVGNVTSKC